MQDEIKHNFKRYTFQAPEAKLYALRGFVAIEFYLDWDSESRDLRITTNHGTIPEILQAYKRNETTLPTEICDIIYLWQLYHENYNHLGTPRQEAYLRSRFGFKLPSIQRCKEALREIDLLEDKHYLYQGKPYRYGTLQISYEIPQRDIQVIDRLINLQRK